MPEEESLLAENNPLRNKILELENQIATFDFSLHNYPKVVENAPFAFTRVLHNTTGFALANKEFTRQSGYTREEFNALDQVEQLKIIHGDDLKGLLEAYKKWSDSGYHDTFHYTYRIINRHKKLLWLDAYYYAELDQDGNPYAIDHIYIDITGSMKSKHELEESNEKYKSLAESIPASVIIFSGSKLSYANDYTVKLTGYSKEELMSMNYWEIVPDDMKNMIRERGQKRLMGEEVPNRYEVKIITKEGRTLCIDFTGTLIRFDGRPSVLGIAYDVTELKIAERALIESEAKYKTIVENMGDALIHVDLDEKILYANENLCRLTQYSKGELLGKTASEIFTEGEDRKKIQEKIRLRKEGIADRYEVKMKRKDGEEIWVEISGAPHRDSSGNIVGSVGLHRDITERKNYEKTIEENLKQKELLLREIHHRVKNNLQIISSLLKLQSGYVAEDKYSEMFLESQNRIKAMTLIHEVLYRSGDLSVINLQEYVSSLVRYLFNSYKINFDKVKYEVNAKKVFVDIDSAIPLGLIINEIVSNSFKYAFPPGKEGMVSVTVTDQPGNSCLLYCKDTGCGLPEGLEFSNVRSLGLRLVKILSDQIGANSEIIRDGGTGYKFLFKKHNYESRM